MTREMVVLPVEEEVRQAKQFLLGLLHERRVPAPEQWYGLEAEHKDLYDLLQDTIQSKTGNACLLIGQPGSGKSMLLQRVLHELAGPPGQPTYHLIRLNGLIETDERSALLSMARQLTILDDVLANETKLGSYANTLTYMLDRLTLSNDTTSIIIELDHFDLFALHHKQSLLYNLFDKAQSSSVPLAIVGLTHRLDAVELLEKRVRSRFSQRLIRLMPHWQRDALVHTLQMALSLRGASLSSAYQVKFAEHVRTCFETPDLLRRWTQLLDMYSTLRPFLHLLAQAVTESKEQVLSLSVLQHILDRHVKVDAIQVLYSDFTPLQLGLLACICMQEGQHDAQFNFEMVYQQMKDFLNTAESNDKAYMFGLQDSQLNRPVVWRAFEVLQQTDLLCPLEAVSKCPKEYRMYQLAARKAQIVQAILDAKTAPLHLKQWADKTRTG